jgi:hypothetical protein
MTHALNLFEPILKMCMNFHQCIRDTAQGRKRIRLLVYNSPLSCLIQDSTSNVINEYMIKPLELDLYMSLNPQHRTFEITYKVCWWPWKTWSWKLSVNSMYFSEQRSGKDNSTQILTFSAYGRFIKKLQVPMHQYRWSWLHSSSAPDQNKGFWGPLSLAILDTQE